VSVKHIGTMPGAREATKSWVQANSN